MKEQSHPTPNMYYQYPYTILYPLRSQATHGNPYHAVMLIRRAIPAEGGCIVCGKKRKGGKLFNYGELEHPIGKQSWFEGLFCSKGCFDRRVP